MAYATKDIQFLTAPEVKPSPKGSLVSEGFYVSGIGLTGHEKPSQLYLHKTGEWGKSTRDGSELKGYFPNEASACACLSQQPVRYHPGRNDRLTPEEAEVLYPHGTYYDV